MGRKNFKAGALTAPLPPVMVTVGDMENSNIITIGWTGILSTIPPRTYISVRPERHSYKLLKQSGEFVINLTRASMAWEVDYVGIYTGAKVDKFKECGFTKLQSREVAPPTISECPLALECRVVEVIPMGTHDVFIADIVSVSCDDEILDKDGRICFERAGLMAYAHGEYYALGEKVGKFGFSTKKKKPPVKPAGGRVNKDADCKVGEKKKVKPAQKAGQASKGYSSAGKTRQQSRPDTAHQTERERNAKEGEANSHKPFYAEIAAKRRGKGRGR